MNLTNENASEYWWLILIQGIFAIIFGVLFLTAPAMTLNTVIIFLGIYWLIGGIFSFVEIFINRSDTPRWLLLLKGVLGVVAGIIVLNHPLWSTVLIPTTLVIILGIQGIIVGAIGVLNAFRGAGFWSAVLGFVSILFGGVLLFNPVVGAAALPFVLGILGLFGGLFLIILAFRARSASAVRAAA
jgi:uncharacterized membrane protein HdeD (DUF308 family)